VFTGYNGTDDGGYLVSVGGIDQPPSKYNISSTAGGTITFVEAPVLGEIVSIRAVAAAPSGARRAAGARPGASRSPACPAGWLWAPWRVALAEVKRERAVDPAWIQLEEERMEAIRRGQGFLGRGWHWLLMAPIREV
jgi:hypothetical protein